MDKTIVGFGSYRISNRSSEHRIALTNALQLGCKLIDTSSNYTDGESEKLIGEVIKVTGIRPILVSKVGYIQGNNLSIIDKLNQQGKAVEDLVEISENLKHSIHPEFIFDQVQRSLDRLGVEFIDTYLLHNPEYFLKTPDANQTEYYKRIKKAFIALEELVTLGKIKNYGISSNTFVVDPSDPEFTDIKRVLELAKEVSENNNFKVIQFPLNLIELGALNRVHDGLNLIEYASSNGIQTMINRPFNAFSSQGFVRLATYEVSENIKFEKVEEFFNHYIQPLVDKWDLEKDEDDEGVLEVPMINQFKKLWFNQNSIDGVEELFFRYFFPFVAQVWGGSLTPEESKPFYEFFDIACEFARKNMNERAQQFKDQSIAAGALEASELDLDILAIEKYKSFAVDYILVGMKRVQYVEKLKNYF